MAMFGHLEVPRFYLGEEHRIDTEVVVAAVVALVVVLLRVILLFLEVLLSVFVVFSIDFIQSSFGLPAPLLDPSLLLVMRGSGMK